MNALLLSCPTHPKKDIICVILERYQVKLVNLFLKMFPLAL